VPQAGQPTRRRHELSHGLCAELLPEAIELDEWGYPILHDVPGRLIPLARRAVADCPTLALLLDRDK
jgi:ferredoxin